MRFRLSYFGPRTRLTRRGASARPTVEQLETRLTPATARFAVIGNYGLAGPSEQAVSKLVHGWNPDFIISTGGNNLPAGAAATVDANVGQYYHDYLYTYNGGYGGGSVSGLNQFFPSLGTHDWDPGNANAYLSYFSLPGNERYYDFTNGPVEMFVIDGNYQEVDGRSSTSKQATWLQNELAASTATWKIIYLENPPYSSGASNASTAVLQWPFRQWGATAVIAGRAPDYERLTEDGLPYFVNGLGGWTKGQFGTPIAGSQLRYNSDLGAMLVDATPEEIDFQFITRSGTVIDNYAITLPPSSVPAAPTDLVASPASGSQMVLQWTDNAVNESGYRIERSTDGVNFAQIGTVGVDITAYRDLGLKPRTTYYYRVRATNSLGDSGYSNVASAVTPLTAHFAIIGDFGLAGQPEQDVANLVHSWSPDFVLTVGDNNYPLGGPDTIDNNVGQYYQDFIYRYTGLYGSGSPTRANRFWPVLGNHDWLTNSAQPYYDYFSLPNNERYYRQNLTPRLIDLFAVDSNFQEPDGRTSTSPQAQWLQSQLASSTAPWKLVLFHHPPYSSDIGDASTTDMQWPFRAWGASAVLAGHAHDYERLEENGIPYFVDGLGGESRSLFAPTPAQGSEVRFGNDYGAMLVDADSRKITYQFITRTGAVIDTFTVYSSPSSHRPAPPSNLSVTPVSATRLNLAWQDNSSNETGFKIERSTDDVTFRQLATVGADVQSYGDTVPDLTQTYYYRVRATNGLGNSDASNVAFDTTPAAPSALTATALSGNKIKLLWADNSNNEANFSIERSLDNVTFIPVSTVAANTVTYIDPGLTPRTTYYYRVQAANAVGNSLYTNTASVTTSSSAVPEAPTNLTATAVTTAQVNLAWSEASTGVTSFTIERSYEAIDFSAIASVSGTTTSYRDTGVQADTQYYYRVTASNAAGTSDYSNVAYAVTSLPPPPTSLSVKAVSSGEIDLSWAVNSTANTSGYKVERSLDGNAFTQIAQVKNGVLTYDDTGLSASTKYFYRVCAYNSVGNSNYTDVESDTTLSG